MEKTLVLVKPGGVQRGLIGNILSKFENAGLKIIGMKMVGVEKILQKDIIEKILLKDMGKK